MFLGTYIRLVSGEGSTRGVLQAGSLVAVVVLGVRRVSWSQDSWPRLGQVGLDHLLVLNILQSLTKIMQ